MISGDTVYIGSDDHNVYAFDTARGRLRTVFGTGGAVSGALALAGDLLVAVSADRTVYGRDLATGTSWTHPMGAPAAGTPAIADGTVYIGSDDHFVYALDENTGRRLWRARTGGAVRSGLLASAAEGYVYAGSDDGHLYALDTGTGQVRWRFTAHGPLTSGLMKDASGNVYFGADDGYLYEVSNLYGASSLGGQQSWRSAVGGAVRGTPASAGGTVYTGSAGSVVYALDSGTGHQIWTCRTGGPVNSGLAIAGTVLYAGSDDGYLYAIDIGAGRVVWRHGTGGPVRSRILVTGGVVYFGSLDHHVYAVRA